jgi:hypothetical protein
MLSKNFAILALFAALPVLAQAPGATVSPFTIAALMRHHGPMQPAGVPASGSLKSYNWGGYVVTGSKFTEVLGSWIAPTVNCRKTPSSYSYYWIGLDGYTDATVELIGTGANCVDSTPEYFAWYDFVPDNPVVIEMTISPGDKMSASVEYSGSKFTLKLTDQTTRKVFKWVRSFPRAQRTSAEWIVNGDALADFTSVSLGDDYTRVNDTNWAVDSAVTGPISDFGTNVQKITLVTTSGTDKAVPTALTTDGSSFKVTWKHE